MPVELKVTYNDGTSELHYIPLQMMRWTKPVEDNTSRTIAPRWAWAHPTYELSIKKPLAQVTTIEIDESGLMADVDRSNNTYGNTVKPE